MTTARVILWGRDIGAVTWLEDRGLGVFEFRREFLNAGIEVAPLTMPVREGVFDFPALPRETFKGLPGMLADSLPDKFGNLLIDRWLAEQGRPADSLNPVERLCYIGQRGMGALEFEPASGITQSQGRPLEIAALVNLAAKVVEERANLSGSLDGVDEAALRDILRVGTSAGGARAKAVLAYNEQTGEFRSGQLQKPPAGFSHWLLKFDGIDGNADKELADPKGFGRLEYACYLLAKDAGIDMMESRLYEEHGRAHFMTRRFDRTHQGAKLHMQSLCAMRHFDFNLPRAYSYEQAIETARLLELPRDQIEQQVRRALVNLVIRNQDDHVKNIAYLMDKRGTWSLAPAFDVVYSYNPSGAWTSQHQMSLSGKTDGFTLEDLQDFGRFADIKPRRLASLLDDVFHAAGKWSDYASKAGVDETLAMRARRGFRLAFD